MRRIIPMLLLLGVATASGCGTTGTYTVAATTSGPELAYVRPGVYVLADWNEPVFYSNNYYWRYDNGYWYRSRSYRGGWHYARPPVAVMRIERPHAYVRYRPQYTRGPTVRDHRSRYYYRDGRRYYR